ncbi:general amidase [Laetiporus sulphureus 93-53]|uniref:amidase n=1 Tax=Laetiporus sulphureus 93-53 TaxID=1314785 RepID=A0A165GS64_9APHY|nr:general amidase [Laetiporus sulphureus 93-53]KZT10734.1 general amidase [Laetiporus sulphureus 93-53]
MSQRAHWKDLVADKKRRQQESIPKDWIITVPPDSIRDVTSVPSTCGLLSPRELEITDTTDVEAILNKLASAEWSSVEATTAFYKRAIIAHQLVNCLTEIFVDRALKRAAELDEHLKTTGKVVGPFHGLPVSLKDQAQVKGLETTIGYVSWVGNYADKNAVIVDILYELGAVPFVRTNLPQTVMWIETNNLLFGRTLNPHNRSLTSGGSSGGEGALLAMKGSPLGVGTDLGGSIRIPAVFNGVYGLRPSTGRLPYYGCARPLAGQDSVSTVLGPLANSVGGMKLFLKAVLAQNPWDKDPTVLRKAWDEEAYKLRDHGGQGGKLCFAIMWDDRVVMPHPPVRRALEMAKEALTQAGHQVIDWEPYKHLEFGNLMNAIWRAGSRQDIAAAVSSSDEPLLASMDLIDPAFPDASYGASYFYSGDGISAYELWQLHKKKEEMQKEYLDRWMSTAEITGTGRPVDAIICPGAPCAAPPHGRNKFVNYTRVWNALDYTACTFPVTKVDPALDVKRPAHKFLSPTDKAYYDFYNPATFENAPVGLQLVGKMHEEEAVLAMVEIVEAALKAGGKPKL